MMSRIASDNRRKTAQTARPGARLLVEGLISPNVHDAGFVDRMAGLVGHLFRTPSLIGQSSFTTDLPDFFLFSRSLARSRLRLGDFLPFGSTFWRIACGPAGSVRQGRKRVRGTAEWCIQQSLWLWGCVLGCPPVATVWANRLHLAAQQVSEPQPLWVAAYSPVQPSGLPPMSSIARNSQAAVKKPGISATGPSQYIARTARDHLIPGGSWRPRLSQIKDLSCSKRS